MDKEYHNKIVKRQELLSKEISRRSVIHSTLITTFGLAYNEYSGDFTNVITLSDLLKS